MNLCTLLNDQIRHSTLFRIHKNNEDIPIFLHGPFNVAARRPATLKSDPP